MRFRIFFVFFLASSSLTHSDEMINDLLAMVADVPITALDLKDALAQKRYNPQGIPGNNESKAMDYLIENAIIDTIMKEEVISISDSQVNEIIKKNMKDNGIPDEKSFELRLQQETGMSLEEYRKEVVRNLKIQQVLQLKVTSAVPQKDEIQSWYNNHRNEVGNKYLVRIIRKSFNPNNPREELSVNQMMNNARQEAMINFNQAAIKYSDDPTASSGGLLGWFRIDELMRKDPMLANIVYQSGIGVVSNVFVLKNSYNILKIDALAPISLDEAEPLIAQRLYQEKQQTAFQTFMKNKRKSTAIKIYMKEYRPS